MASTTSGTVAGFTVSPQTGALTAAPGSPYALAGTGCGPVAFDASGGELAVAERRPYPLQGGAALFGVDLSTGGLAAQGGFSVPQVPVQNGNPDSPCSAALRFTPGGALIAASQDLGWTAAQQLAVSEMEPVPGSFTGLPGSPALPVTDDITSGETPPAIDPTGTLIASPDGSGVVVGTLPGAARPIGTGPYGLGLPGADSDVVSFSDDGVRLASGNSDGSVTIWEVG